MKTNKEETEKITLKEIPNMLYQISCKVGKTVGSELSKNIKILREIWHQTKEIQEILLRSQGTMGRYLFEGDWNNGICSFCPLIKNNKK